MTDLGDIRCFNAGGAQLCVGLGGTGERLGLSREGGEIGLVLSRKEGLGNEAALAFGRGAEEIRVRPTGALQSL